MRSSAKCSTAAEGTGNVKYMEGVKCMNEFPGIGISLRRTRDEMYGGDLRYMKKRRVFVVAREMYGRFSGNLAFGRRQSEVASAVDPTRGLTPPSPVH